MPIQSGQRVLGKSSVQVAPLGNLYAEVSERQHDGEGQEPTQQPRIALIVRRPYKMSARSVFRSVFYRVYTSRARELTGRTRSVSLTRMVEELSPYLRGWQGYFGYCQTPSVLRDLQQWLRRRLRAVQWAHWKHGSRRYAELRKRGVWAEWAAKIASSAHGPRRLSYAKAVKIALPDAFFDSLGLPMPIG